MLKIERKGIKQQILNFLYFTAENGFHVNPSRTSAPLVKSKFNIRSIKSGHVNLVAPASPVDCLLY